MLLGLNQYAKHRGTWLCSVQRAIARGIIERMPDGKIDVAASDQKWDRWLAEHRGPTGIPLLEDVPELGDLPVSDAANPIPLVMERRDPPAPERISEQEARRRKEVALAELRQMEVAEKAGRLIDAQEVRERWSGVASRVRDAVLAIPDKCAPGVAGTTGVDAAQVRAALQLEVENILRQLHDDLQSSN